MGRKKKKQLKPWCWYPFSWKTYWSQKKDFIHFTGVKSTQSLYQHARGVKIYGIRFRSPYKPVRMSPLAQSPFAIIIRRSCTLFAPFPVRPFVYIKLKYLFIFKHLKQFFTLLVFPLKTWWKYVVYFIRLSINNAFVCSVSLFF